MMDEKEKNLYYNWLSFMIIAFEMHDRISSWSNSSSDLLHTTTTSGYSISFFKHSKTLMQKNVMYNFMHENYV